MRKQKLCEIKNNAKAEAMRTQRENESDAKAEAMQKRKQRESERDAKANATRKRKRCKSGSNAKAEATRKQTRRESKIKREQCKRTCYSTHEKAIAMRFRNCGESESDATTTRKKHGGHK
jgi:hypothetical protein